MAQQLPDPNELRGVSNAAAERLSELGRQTRLGREASQAQEAREEEERIRRATSGILSKILQEAIESARRAANAGFRHAAVEVYDDYYHGDPRREYVIAADLLVRKLRSSGYRAEIKFRKFKPDHYDADPQTAIDVCFSW